MKRQLILAVLVVALSWPAAHAKAHVLLRDKSADVAAVLHINPDDDPIAGKVSQLYFDIQNQNSEVRIPSAGYEVIVTDSSGTQDIASATAHESTVVATYTFPVQGLYHLTLRSKPQYDQFQKISMSYDIRVERGVAGGVVKPTHEIAQTIMLVSLAAIPALGVVFFNNRRGIARQSTW